MTFSEKLSEAIRARQVSLRELSEQTGIPKSAIQRYTSGDTEKIPIDRVKLMAEALGVDPAYILGWTDEESPSDRLPANVRPLSSMHRQQVPLIGRVAAGEPIMAPEDCDVFVDSPVQCDAAIEVQGDSMIPCYQDGDVVYIRCQPDVTDGQVAIVFLDDEAAIKHVYHDPDGLTLISDNPEYAPIRARADDYDRLRIFGVPVGFTRMYKADPLKKLKKGFKK